MARYDLGPDRRQFVRDKGHKGPQDQYSFVSIYGDHAIGVMSSVFRASPRDRWPDRVMSLQVLPVQ